MLQLNEISSYTVFIKLLVLSGSHIILYVDVLKYSIILDVIKKLTSFKKPVYLLVYREGKYVDWTTVLKANGNVAEAKAITDCALADWLIMYRVSSCLL